MIHCQFIKISSRSFPAYSGLDFGGGCFLSNVQPGHLNTLSWWNIGTMIDGEGGLSLGSGLGSTAHYEAMSDWLPEGFGMTRIMNI